jgi:hypothetical protein
MVGEAPGPNCLAGGTKIEVGLDDGTPTGTAKNATLEAGEVDHTSYVCMPSPRTKVYLCGTSGYNIAPFIPTGYTLTTGNCAPDVTVKAMLIARAGTGSFNAAALKTWVEAGGRVLTEFSNSDEVFNAVFGTAVAQGLFTGGCSDQMPLTVQFSPGDAFWSANTYVADLGSSGCGYNIDAFPGITPLAGWAVGQTSIAYRNAVLGRVWLTEYDWQDGAPKNAQTVALMKYMIAN